MKTKQTYKLVKPIQVCMKETLLQSVGRDKLFDIGSIKDNVYLFSLYKFILVLLCWKL
jgi:hypothetical protein